MARTKTQTIKVKVDDKGTVVVVKAECADVSTLSREALEALYVSQWKQYMYSEVQTTVKRLYPAIASNALILNEMRSTLPGATDAIMAVFVAGLEKKMGTKFDTQLPNLFTLSESATKGEFRIEYQTVTPVEGEEEIPDIEESEAGETEN